jgi:hypothetical protein
MARYLVTGGGGASLGARARSARRPGRRDSNLAAPAISGANTAGSDTVSTME